MYLIQETAKISGVSIRTLHYYDEIGLLVPQKDENQYRYYSQEDIDRLQLILFYKQLNFSLKEIQKLLSETDKSRLTILTEQLVLMRLEQQKLQQLVQTLEQSIQHLKGEIEMTNEQKFTGFKYEDNVQYRQEAIDKYGEAVILESEHRQKGNEQQMMDLMNEVFGEFARLNKESVDISDEVTQQQVHQLFQLIRQYSFDCTKEVFGYIGLSYVSDERFTHNIDQFGKGTAQYASDAIQYYVKS